MVHLLVIVIVILFVMLLHHHLSTLMIVAIAVHVRAPVGQLWLLLKIATRV
jgi:hypothetical protein